MLSASAGRRILGIIHPFTRLSRPESFSTASDLTGADALTASDWKEGGDAAEKMLGLLISILILLLTHSATFICAFFTYQENGLLFSAFANLSVRSKDWCGRTTGATVSYLHLLHDRVPRSWPLDGRD